MKKLTVEAFETKLTAIPEEKPDKWDLEMLASVEAENDTNEGVPLWQVIARRECSGKLSVRVPKELHYSLLEDAKENGVSLNQYIVYKLART
jgi:antitoxin HicB